MLCFLGYEFYLFKKEKEKRTKPIIPSFSGNINPGTLPNLVVAKTAKKTGINVFWVVSTILLFVFFGVASVVGIFYKNAQKTNQQTSYSQQPVIKKATSTGIQIYNKEWKELKGSDLEELESGNSVYIAIKTINNVDIDKARIRVNEDSWLSEHVTKNFNKQYNVFYKEHQIGNDGGELKIEAQLHSGSDGWLGN